MPPKKSDKQKQNELQQNASMLMRPATPNDYRIVATVKSLQGLVNTEHKWKVRLNDAQRTEHLVHSKIRRLKHLIEQCHKGIRQLEQDLDSLVEEHLNQVSLDHNTNQQWASEAMAHAKAGNPLFSPSTPAQPSPLQNQQPAKGKKPKEPHHAPVAETGKDFNQGDLSQLPAGFWELRRQQAECLRNIVNAYFNLPRLARERKVQRPASPIEMQHELDEAFRLSTPVADLAVLQQQHAATPEPGQKRQTKQQQTQGKPPKGSRGAKAKPANAAPVEEAVQEEVDMYLFSPDLRPQDFLSLPVPRGLDTRMLGKVLQLRSRKLRLEASIVLFQQEMQPLEQRLVGIADMEHLGEYSIAAVQPAIATTVDEEQSLQRVRQQEDEIFASKTKPPVSSPSSKQKRGESA